ncbi:MAG: hypothetical protein J6Y79_03810 [Paludibacteraceae bacterium]|nr:hypothetical protein [Paludibacteraceae bacterium]
MKHLRFLSLFFAFFLALPALQAQGLNSLKISLRWQYKMSEFGGVPYTVGLEDKGSTYNLYITGESESRDRATEIGILVEHKDLKAFREYLGAIRDKYAEWSQVAKDNAVRNYQKDFAVNYNAYIFFQTGGLYYFKYNNPLDEWFSVDQNNVPKVKIITARYVEDGVRNAGRLKMTFRTVEELDALIRIIDEAGPAIAADRAKRAKVDALFR